MGDEYKQREHIARIIEDCPCDDCTSCLHDNKPCKGYEAAKKIMQNGYGDVRVLKSENVELRARLDKAMELPCKPGDTIYWLCEDEKTIREGIVVKFTIEGSGIWVFCKYYKDDFTYWHTLECFCEDVYTDKSEAEARLEEKRKDEQS